MHIDLKYFYKVLLYMSSLKYRNSWIFVISFNYFAVYDRLEHLALTLMNCMKKHSSALNFLENTLSYIRTSIQVMIHWNQDTKTWKLFWLYLQGDE